MKKIVSLLTIGLMLSIAINSMFITGVMDDEVVDEGIDEAVDMEMQGTGNKYGNSTWWGSTRITDYRVGTDWLALPDEGNVTWGADADFEAIYNSTSDELEWTGGDQTFDGNIIAANVGMPAYIFAHTNATIPVAGVGTWTNVTFNEHLSLNQSITHNHADNTNHSFTVQIAGTYKISWFGLFQNSNLAEAHVVIRTVKNGVEIPGSIAEDETYHKLNVTQISSCTMVQCVVGDVLILQFTSTATTVSLQSHGDYADHPDSSCTCINRMG